MKTFIVNIIKGFAMVTVVVVPKYYPSLQCLGNNPQQQMNNPKE